jgi:hypothetical protein
MELISIRPEFLDDSLLPGSHPHYSPYFFDKVSPLSMGLVQGRDKTTQDGVTDI